MSSFRQGAAAFSGDQGYFLYPSLWTHYQGFGFVSQALMNEWQNPLSLLSSKMSGDTEPSTANFPKPQTAEYHNAFFFRCVRIQGKHHPTGLGGNHFQASHGHGQFIEGEILIFPIENGLGSKFAGHDLFIVIEESRLGEHLTGWQIVRQRETQYLRPRRWNAPKYICPPKIWPASVMACAKSSGDCGLPDQILQFLADGF